MTPLADELGEHAVRTQFVVLAKSTVHGELVVGHALFRQPKHRQGRTHHIRFVGLDVVLQNRLQFGSRDSVEESVLGSAWDCGKRWTYSARTGSSKAISA